MKYKQGSIKKIIKMPNCEKYLVNTGEMATEQGTPLGPLYQVLTKEEIVKQHDKKDNQV